MKKTIFTISLCFVLTYSYSQFIKKARVDEAVIKTELSKEQIISGLKSYFVSKGLGQGSIDSIDTNMSTIEHDYSFIIPGYNKFITPYPILRVNFHEKVIIADNKIKVTYDNYSGETPYCVKKNRQNEFELCNCISKEDSIAMEKKGKEQQLFVTSYSDVFDVWYTDLYQDQKWYSNTYKKDGDEVSLNFDGKGRNYKEELRIINEKVKAGNIKFLTLKEHLDIAKYTFGDKYVKEKGLDIMMKSYSEWLAINPDIWEQYIYPDYIISNYKAIAEALKGSVQEIGLNGLPKLTLVDGKLIPNDTKERKKWYKENNISKDEQNKIEPKFTQK